MSGNNVRLVLFDIGGVLVELSGLTILLKWLEHRITPEQAYTFWLTSPVVRAFETGKIETGVFAEQLIAELHLPLQSEDFLREFSSWGQRVLPGAVELVKRVPEDCTRATLCNTNAVHWPVVMKHRELLSVFDHHFASHLTGKIKPDEEAFQHVLETLGCRPQETVFVDDSRLNVAAAKRVGIRAYQVKGPTEAERALRDAGVAIK